MSDTTLPDTDTDNPSAAVGFVALIALVLLGAAGTAGFMWMFVQVTR